MVRRSRYPKEELMSGEVLCKPRFDAYVSITEAILSAIASGSGEFRMPWHQAGSEFWQPRPSNALTAKPYRGVNTIALWAEAMQRGFEFQCWATYRQWQTLGAQVRKGERGAVVVFYKSDSSSSDEEEEKSAKTRRVLRASWVFNVAQVDGWTVPELPQENRVELLDNAERFVTATKADIREQGSRACYSPSGDYIQMPPRNSFVGTDTISPTEAFYATLFHELTHWTGHPSRLDRHLTSRFGDEAYAMEELIAELGAAFLCADLTVTNAPRQDHAQYINSWYTLLSNDKRAIFVAASKASYAAEYLLGLRSPMSEAQ